MRETLADYCRRTEREELLAQWDTGKNLPLTPETISYGSKRRIWWQCESGHTWQTTLCTRTSGGAGCPVCAGKVPLEGKSDLASLRPELAAQWHPTKNGALTPQQVLPGSHQKVWWRCARGHEWQTQIKSRTAGCGCPVCAGRQVQPRETDLATQFPQLAAQWHPTKNAPLTAGEVAPGSSRRIWWICERGHQWLASVVSRTSAGHGCPVCAGRQVLAGENDLATQFPQLAAQWHPTKNNALTPRQVTSCSNRKVWWQCERGHDYQAAVAARTMNGSGCPYCTGKKVLTGFNDLATRFPELAAQWHPALNESLRPEMVTSGAHRKVWWICPLGHVWKAAVYSRSGPKRCGCPVCAGQVTRSRLRQYQSGLSQQKEAIHVL